MSEEKFQVITFDCYGTLIDWETGIKSFFQSEAERDGIEIDDRQIIPVYGAEEPEVESGAYRPYREVLSETARRVARRFGWDLKPERADLLAESLTYWKPFFDTNPALERLARRFELGILSNIDDDLLAQTRKRFTVDFRIIVTAQQVKSYKPRVAHFEKARALAGDAGFLHAAQSYFHDVVPATRLNIPVAWINRNASVAEVNGPSPTFELRNLAELADLLQT
jgi:2-haloacid dehalogenase/putative hydrolase of the HAD superfamily